MRGIHKAGAGRNGVDNYQSTTTCGTLDVSAGSRTGPGRAGPGRGGSGPRAVT